ncbi:hypothetical protein ILUMI_03803 [Ignelater luminosus]|uniref:Peptidase A2 domain-containing protein n=1 Tax=Ignelater luminosus TaxID=2038154 RepID=A0A8K0DF41_IGNLU|nr:hypothetical protein ILUMI_03803 [Ignelater luminosus]
MTTIEETRDIERSWNEIKSKIKEATKREDEIVEQDEDIKKEEVEEAVHKIKLGKAEEANNITPEMREGMEWSPGQRYALIRALHDRRGFLNAFTQTCPKCPKPKKSQNVPMKPSANSSLGAVPKTSLAKWRSWLQKVGVFYKNFEISSGQVIALLDTGAEISIIGRSGINLLESQGLEVQSPDNVSAFTAAGVTQPVQGMVRIPITINSSTKYLTFWVIPSFQRSSLQHLGYMIDTEGLRTCSEKVSAIKEFSKPHTVAELKRFLVSVSMKELLNTALVPATPDFSQQFFIQTDASDR